MTQTERDSQCPSPAAIRAALNRICGSRPFKAAPRLAAFLRFVVEAVLDGRAGSIKGYTVAVEALGRPGTFDPATDSCVRVEAGRLRLALSRYYDDEGATDPVVVDLPRGTYVPAFRLRCMADVDGNRLRAAVQGRHAAPDERHLLFAECHRAVFLMCQSAARLKAELATSRSVLERSRGLVEHHRLARKVSA